MRRACVAVIGTVVASVVVLALLAGTKRTSLAFTPGVLRAFPAVVLRAGDEVCQRPIDVPAGGAFDHVTLGVGTFFRPGSPLRVQIRDPMGRVFARGAVPGGYPDIGQEPV